MADKSGRWIKRGAIILVLLTIGTGVAATPAAAHDDNKMHCHYTIKTDDAKSLTEDLMTRSPVGALEITIEAFREPVGYIEAPWEKDCHSMSL